MNSREFMGFTAALKLLAIRRAPLLKTSVEKLGFYAALNYAGIILAAIVAAVTVLAAWIVVPDLMSQWRLSLAGALMALSLVVAVGENIMEDGSELETCVCIILGYPLKAFRYARFTIRVGVCLPALLPLALVLPIVAVLAVGAIAWLDLYVGRCIRWLTSAGRAMRLRAPFFEGLVYLPRLTVIRLCGLFLQTAIAVAAVLVGYRLAGFAVGAAVSSGLRAAFAAVAALGFKSVFFYASVLNRDVQLWKVLGIKPLAYHTRSYSILCAVFVAAAALGFGAYSVVVRDGMTMAGLATLVGVIVMVSLFDYWCGSRYAKFGMDKRNAASAHNTKFFAVGRGAVMAVATAFASLSGSS